MKKINLLYLVLLSIAATTWIGCSDWTEPEAKDYFHGPSEEYYAALRAYKQTKHEVSFGWYGNWTGAGASFVNCLEGLPDSVDIISLWANSTNLNEPQKRDLKRCQEVKGTKVLYCLLVLDIGDHLTPEEYTVDYNMTKEFWGWVDGDDEKIKGACEKYANAVCDTIDKYNYDGFDLDWEPGYAQPFPTHYDMAKGDRIKWFLQVIIDRLKTNSNKKKILVIDGQPDDVPAEMGPNIDYFISQAYGASSIWSLENGGHRLMSTISHYNGILTPEEVTNRFIVTENFESVGVALAGGFDFTDPDGKSMKSLEGMARWKPTNGFRKGGCGTYHMEAEYPTNPEYKNLRNAIQIMNPASQPLDNY